MNEQAIFLAALEFADPDERAEYIRQACGGDATLERQVLALLAMHQRSGEFLDVPALRQMAGDAAPDLAAGAFAVTSGGQPAAGDSEVDLSFLEPPTQPGSLGRLRHYTILGVLGQGGYGIVLKAFDETLHRVVAIKVLAPELATTSPARKRFLREARAAAAIRHENVIAIYAVEDEPLPFLVMEYIAGPTLQERIDETGPLDVLEILQIGQQIARGLEAAHGIGLVHRDIKPGNILLEEGRSRVKITDFGLARTADDASLTQSGMIAGTPLYMSPEQALGAPIDPRSDLFSLGSVLYVMCSGRPPFRASTTLAVLRRVAEDQPRAIQEIIPETPLWLIAIIARLHAKSPADRFRSAKEVADLLERCQAELQQQGYVECVEDDLATIALPRPRAHQDEPAAPVKPEKKPALSAPPARGHRWLAAGVLAVLLLAALSLTEASGVTNVRGTVLRLFSPEGVLVVEVDDPGVSVSIDGEEMVITGAGAKEIRLRPGQYKVLASKDGRLVTQELVTVTRNGRQVVRVSRESLRTDDAARPQTMSSLPPRFSNSLGMEFALVPKGEFLMGGGGGKPGDKQVAIEEDFYLGVYEVTQEEWEKLMGANPSYFSRTGHGKDRVAGYRDEYLKRLPVESITWPEAQEFLQRLNAQEAESGWTYRLPTEAEWEYACRGGPSANPHDYGYDFYFKQPSNQLAPHQANVLAQPGSATPDRLALLPKPVGSYTPNRLGLHDMHGNVFEWCDDNAEPLPDKPSWRGYRGGCFYSNAWQSGAAARATVPPDKRLDSLGLRVARVRVEFGLAAKPARPVDGFVSLFNGRDLTGWSTYSGPADGWSVRDGELVCSSPSTFLYATKSGLADMHLRIEAQISPGGLAQAILRSAFTPHPPNGYYLNLSDQDAPQRTGSIQNLGIVSERLHGPDEWVTLEAILQGTHIETRVNGKQAASFDDSRFRSGVLGLHVATPETTLRIRKIEMKPLPPAAPPREPVLDRFVTIFDGKSADSWQTFEGDAQGWRLEDGVLVSDGESRNLYFDHDYQDFHLRAEVLVAKGTNATIGLRTPFAPDEEGPQLYGLVVAGQHPSKAATGSLQSLAPAKPSGHGVDEWITMEAICRGSRIATRVNGQTVLDVIDRRFRSGRVMLSNKQGGVFKVRKVEIQEFAPVYFNALGMEFAPIPPGKAWLGGGKGRFGHQEVEFSQAFYLGVAEVTQAQWMRVMGRNPSGFARTGPSRGAVQQIPQEELDQFPVETVTWNDCQEFLDTLNGLCAESGWVYRLPTEMEWEYACRGGPMQDESASAYDFYFEQPTNELTAAMANIENKLLRTERTRSYLPNRLGLYDMHGNVWEWCDDRLPDKDGTPQRVHRGGAANRGANIAAAAVRETREPTASYSGLGLRVARVRIEAPSAAVPGMSAEELAALEWVLQNGGILFLLVDGKEVRATPGDRLPSQPFEVKSVDLKRIAGFNESTAENLKSMPRIHWTFWLPPATDDAVFAKLSTYPGIRRTSNVDLAGTSISDEALVHLKKYGNLWGLNLKNTQVSAKGLNHLRDLPNRGLNLSGCKKIDDDACAVLGSMPRFGWMQLSETSITDAGLAKLAGCKNLTSLDVLRCKVSEDAVRQLAAALPNCTIRWDGGAVTPEQP